MTMFPCLMGRVHATKVMGVTEQYCYRIRTSIRYMGEADNMAELTSGACCESPDWF